MMHLTDIELDSLFVDGDEMVIEMLEELSTTPFPFIFLPAELRNMVYEYYFEDYTTSNNVLQINTFGEMPSTAIISVSRQLRSETIGYLKPCIQDVLKKTAFKIEAQIKDYDFAPLQDRLTLLSEGNDNTRRTLCKETTVTFIGGFNMPNIVAWFTGNQTHYEHSHLFREAGIDHPPSSLISGTLSLKVIVDTFRSTPTASWKSCALRFLAQTTRITDRYNRDRSRELLRGKRMDLGSWEGLDLRNSKAEIALVVFEVVARWHHYVRTVLGRGKGRNAKVDRMAREEAADMEMVMWDFVTECFRLE